MLVLFETAAGFALFKVLQEGKLKEATDLWQDFSSLDSAQSVRAAFGAIAQVLKPLDHLISGRLITACADRQAQSFRQV